VAITTGHHGSKFGLPPDQALEAIAQARAAGLEVAGLHVHIRSQLLDAQAAHTSVDWLSERVRRGRGPRRSRVDAESS
jgi:diaminopimelate decarboxylase